MVFPRVAEGNDARRNPGEPGRYPLGCARPSAEHLREAAERIAAFLVERMAATIPAARG
jgi:hypothetical protein